MTTAAETASLYRVDRFTVPLAARDEFLQRLVAIRDFLAAQPGCLFDRIAETPAEDGVLKMMTIVEWRDAAAAGAAREKAAAHYETSGFNPQDFMRRLDITPDFGMFRDVSA